LSSLLVFQKSSCFSLLHRCFGMVELCVAAVLIAVRSNLNHAHHLLVAFFILDLDLVKSLRLLFPARVSRARIQLQQPKFAA